MNGHKLPLDPNRNLTNENKLQMERDNAELKIKEIKKRLWPLTRRAALSILIPVAMYGFFIPRVGWIGIAAYVILLSVFSKNIYDIISALRELKKTKKKLQNWDAVIEDYKEAIK